MIDLGTCNLIFTVQVKSNTVQGNRHHSREHVIANIVKANIPVANGIVHLIDRPLIVVAAPLWKYLEEEVTKRILLNRFKTLILCDLICYFEFLVQCVSN